MKPYEYTQKVYRLCQLAIVIVIVLYWNQIISTIAPYMEILK